MPRQSNHSTSRPLMRIGYDWIAQFCDPIRALRGLRGLPWYARDLRAYRRQAGAEPITWRDLTPALHEHAPRHELDTHYFYVNAWAARRILAKAPSRHVDVASQIVLASLLSASVPVTYVDYRPLDVGLDNLESRAGDILALPYDDNSLASLSCLHVAEHIGLGRYGDPLDPHGTRKAARELARVLAPSGHLFFAVPVGRPRVCFNAHRIHAPETIREYFADLALVEFSGVHDDGGFVSNVPLNTFRDSQYACGMFWFSKHG